MNGVLGYSMNVASKYRCIFFKLIEDISRVISTSHTLTIYYLLIDEIYSCYLLKYYGIITKQDMIIHALPLQTKYLIYSHKYTESMLEKFS